MKKGCVIDFILQVTFFIMHYSLPRVIMLQVLSIIRLELMFHTCFIEKQVQWGSEYCTFKLQSTSSPIYIW